MESKQKINVQLQCATCGGIEFEFNEDKSYVKCKCCDREYFGGQNELIELNQEYINQEKERIAEDLKKEITESFKNAFKDNKFIKFK